MPDLHETYEEAASGTVTVDGKSQEFMIGHEIAWSDSRGNHRGFVVKVLPATLMDVRTHERLEAVQFEVKTKHGRILRTTAVRPLRHAETLAGIIKS